MVFSSFSFFVFLLATLGLLPEPPDVGPRSACLPGHGELGGLVAERTDEGTPPFLVLPETRPGTWLYLRQRQGCP